MISLRAAIQTARLLPRRLHERKTGLLLVPCPDRVVRPTEQNRIVVEPAA
jgi:hypothetical protein